MKQIFKLSMLLLFLSLSMRGTAQWTALANTSTNTCKGGMLLLSDGRVLLKTGAGGAGR